MINTIEVFNDRKLEIEFYFSVILDYDKNGTKVINTIDNKKVFQNYEIKFHTYAIQFG